MKALLLHYRLAAVLNIFLCSAVPTTPAAGGGLFGSTATPAPAAGGLFGAPGEFCSYAALLDSLCSRL